MPQTMADLFREEGIRIGEAQAEARWRLLEREAMARSFLVDILETMFGGTPPALAGDVLAASEERCRELIRLAVASPSLDEFLRCIRS